MSAPLSVIEESLKNLDYLGQFPTDEQWSFRSQALKGAEKAERASDPLLVLLGGNPFTGHSTSSSTVNAAGSITAVIGDPNIAVVGVGNAGSNWYQVNLGVVTNHVYLDKFQRYSEATKRAYDQYLQLQFIGDGTNVAAPQNTVWIDPQVGTSPRPVEDRYPWLSAVYELVAKGQSRRALRAIFVAVETQFAAHQFDALNEVLANVDLSKLDVKTMTGILRITGRAESVLSAWRPLLTRVRSELERLHVADIRGLLVGLERP